jgi:hypothetical protein
VPIAEQVGVAIDRQTNPAKRIDVRDDPFEQVGADLDLADARLGLGVGDPEVRTACGVEAQVADVDIAQLADPHTGSSEGGDDRADGPRRNRGLRSAGAGGGR